MWKGGASVQTAAPAGVHGSHTGGGSLNVLYIMSFITLNTQCPTPPCIYGIPVIVVQTSYCLLHMYSLICISELLLFVACLFCSGGCAGGWTCWRGHFWNTSVFSLILNKVIIISPEFELYLCESVPPEHLPRGAGKLVNLCICLNQRPIKSLYNLIKFNHGIENEKVQL